MSNQIKRILIVNDDMNEEVFFNEYPKLAENRECIQYFQDINKAINDLYIEDFCIYDRIILDIRIDSELSQQSRVKLEKYIDLKSMEDTKTNYGFVLFMYLIARGYPIERIAFLSAYVELRDDQFSVKQQLLKELKLFQTKNEENDSRVLELSGGFVESLKRRIKKYLKSEDSYEPIVKLLEADIDTGNKTNSNNSTDDKLLKENNEFFEKLAATGFKKINKFHKSQEDKVVDWIHYASDENGVLKKYYEYRIMVLSACEFLKNRNLKIYGDYYKIKEIYDELYFNELLNKIKSELEMTNDENRINHIIHNNISNIVMFWESIRRVNSISSIFNTVDTIKDKKEKKQDLKESEKLIEENLTDEEIYLKFASSMVLKNTRNWYYHGRLENLNSKENLSDAINFMSFIFISSITMLFGYSSSKEFFMEILKDCPNVKERKQPSSIWKEINKEIDDINNNHSTDFDLNRGQSYILDIIDLFIKYGNENGKSKIHLSTKTIYQIFILSLHAPYLSSDLQVKFYKENSYNNEYICKLENYVNNLIDEMPV